MTGRWAEPCIEVPSQEFQLVNSLNITVSLPYDESGRLIPPRAVENLRDENARLKEAVWKTPRGEFSKRDGVDIAPEA